MADALLCGQPANTAPAVLRPAPACACCALERQHLDPLLPRRTDCASPHWRATEQTGHNRGWWVVDGGWWVMVGTCWMVGGERCLMGSSRQGDGRGGVVGGWQRMTNVQLPVVKADLTEHQFDLLRPGRRKKRILSERKQVRVRVQ